MRRTVLAALTAVAITVPTLTTAAVAATPTIAAASHHTKAKAVRFNAAGSVTAVDPTSNTITLYARGGTKDVRKRTITVSVADDAVVRVNGRRATLSSIAAGYRIDVTGRTSASGWTASRVVASGKVRSTPSPTPSATPSPTPSDEPTTEPGDDD